MPDTGVDGEVGIAATGPVRIDHRPAILYRYRPVLIAVKCPDGEMANGGDGPGIAAATDGSDGRETLRIGDSQRPYPIAAHTQPRHIHAVGIDGIVVLDFVQQFGQGVDIRLPAPPAVCRTLGRDKDKGEMLPRFNVFDGPCQATICKLSPRSPDPCKNSTSGQRLPDRGS